MEKDDLLSQVAQTGIIELLDVEEEEEDAQIACGIDILRKAQQNPEYPQFTHCELDPSFLLSLNAGLIPFANRNLVTRTLYQSEKHSRQAIGYCWTPNPKGLVWKPKRLSSPRDLGI